MSKKRTDDGASSLNSDDVILTKEIDARVSHLDDLATAINFGSWAQVRELGITAQANLTNRDRKAIFTVKIPGGADMDFTKWSLQLAGFLFHARSIMDNLMWEAVNSGPLVKLTERQLAQVYFPISAKQENWKSFLGTPHAKVIRPVLLERIEAVQPFLRPLEATSRAMLYLHKLHRTDKHRTPLRLFPIADSQWPMVFDIEAAGGKGRLEWVVAWLNPRVPIVNRLSLAEVTTTRAMLSPSPSTVPLTLVADLGGDHYDLQDLMWDVFGAALRVADVVGWGNTIRADLWDAGVAFERERLATFSDSFVNGSDEWSNKYGDGKSPLDDVYAEVRELGHMQPRAEQPEPVIFLQKPRPRLGQTAKSATPPAG